MKNCFCYSPWQIFSTAGTKYLSQTRAKATNKYKLAMMCRTKAPCWRSLSEKKSLGKSSMAGCVQLMPGKKKQKDE